MTWDAITEDLGFQGRGSEDRASFDNAESERCGLASWCASPNSRRKLQNQPNNDEEEQDNFANNILKIVKSVHDFSLWGKF